MDIGRSFTYMFDDEKWVQKLAIGGLLVLASIIPLVNIFTLLVMMGYSLRLLKNVAEGSETPLPDWDDWGGDWVKGLMIFLASLIYSLPILLLTGLGALVEAMVGYGNGSEVAGICAAGASCLSGLWGLALGIVLPAAMIKYAEKEEFGAFFRFGEIFRLIGDNLGNYVIAVLLGVVAQFVAGFGVIACVIGVFFTAFWSTLVSSHLLGQVAQTAGFTPAMATATASASAEPTVASYGDLQAVDYLVAEEEQEDDEADEGDTTEL